MLGYSAEDDLGLGEVDLVYKVGGAGERRKRVRTIPEPPKGTPDGARQPPVRSLAAKMEWDLSEIDLSPGTTVTYHMEARDLDSVSGPNVGRSRGYALRILSPRERADALLASQEQLRELTIHLLGDRIDLTKLLQPGSTAAAATPATADGREATGDGWERLQAVHRKAETLLVHLGRIGRGQSDDKNSGASKDLLSTLQEIGQRLGSLTQEEEALLGELRSRRGPAGPSRRLVAGKEVSGLNERHVAELERDTLLLDDLIGRQRLEELLAISDEMTALRDRMRQLLAEYKKSPSEALRRELERELRGFERRMAELMEKARHLANELPDEFLNREAMGQTDLQSRIDRLRDLIQKGDLSRAEQEMERMSQALDNLVKGMEQNLRGFRRERFTAEEKALGELLGQEHQLQPRQGSFWR